MYCPECRSEYREGFTTCVDCEKALIPELPPLPPEDHEGEPMVTVLEVGDPARLALAHSLLDDAGIPCFGKGEALQGGLSFLVSPVQIQVPESQAEEARELLADLESAEPSATLEELE